MNEFPDRNACFLRSCAALLTIEYSLISVSEASKMYLHRTVEQSLPSLCQNFKVILISGMRKVGKRTLLQCLDTNDRKYVSLGKFEDYELALTSPSAFFRQHQLPLIIDEIQRVPQLFRQVKAEVDKSDACSQVWLSGSQHFSLMQNV